MAGLLRRTAVACVVAGAVVAVCRRDADVWVGTWGVMARVWAVLLLALQRRRPSMVMRGRARHDGAVHGGRDLNRLLPHGAPFHVASHRRVESAEG